MAIVSKCVSELHCRRCLLDLGAVDLHREPPTVGIGWHVTLAASATIADKDPQLVGEMDHVFSQ